MCIVSDSKQVVLHTSKCQVFFVKQKQQIVYMHIIALPLFWEHLVLLFSRKTTKSLIQAKAEVVYIFTKRYIYTKLKCRTDLIIWFVLSC